MHLSEYPITRKRKPQKIHLTEPFPGACCCLRVIKLDGKVAPRDNAAQRNASNEKDREYKRSFLTGNTLHPNIGEEWSKIDVFMQRTAVVSLRRYWRWND
ncbi:hypothetical protein CBL_03499 [Carabus blaptoides fortunei]